MISKKEMLLVMVCANGGYYPDQEAFAARMYSDRKILV
jgi:hypothetical protein